MKQRVISGIVMAIIVAAVVALGEVFSAVIIVFLSLLCAIATYEMLHSTGIVKNKAALISACAYSAIAVFLHTGYIAQNINFSEISWLAGANSLDLLSLLNLLYILCVVVITLCRYKNFGVHQITMSIAIPIILAYAFSSINSAFMFGASGFFGLLLLLNFSCVCDCGAYFIGRAFGKHKLAPVISPKKTVEGAIGGIAFSLIGTLIIVLSFGAFGIKSEDSLWVLLLITPVFCVIGMMGDLFASAIKRSCGVKDYGTLIPGHGGIMDRLDSILLIAPFFEFCIKSGIF